MGKFFLKKVVCFTEFLCEIFFHVMIGHCQIFLVLVVIERNYLELFDVCFRFYTVQMAPKKRPHSKSSSSHSRFDTTRFPTINKAIQFKNHFMKRTVESEREVAENLLDQPVCCSITRRNWNSLLKFEISKIYTDRVREFYSKMDFVASAILKTYVRGTWITIYVDDIAEFLDIPVVEDCDYPIPEDSQVSINYDMIVTTLCGEDTCWPGGYVPHGNLTKEYRFLNRFVYHNLEPRGHTSDVNHKNGYMLYCIGRGKRS